MTWRSTKNPICMAEAALGFIRRLSTQHPCRLSPDACPSISRQFLTPICLRRHFSGSDRTLLPRTRSHSNGYPGFRNESRERRHVREHNLFDPQLQSPDSTDDASYLPDPLEPARTLTRPPRTLPSSRTSTSDLERELLFTASRYPTSARTRNLFHHILYDRKEQPAAIHYEALILFNVSPEHGSAQNIRKLAEEMDQLGIPMNINIYNAILRTLVVHPDVDILNEVVEACGRMWIEIDSEMQHLICAAYVRAGMPDIALEYLEQIEYGTGNPTLCVSRSGLQRGKAELWLYTIFIQQLAEDGDWEGVMRLCYRLCDDTSLGIPLASRHLDVPWAFWNWLLDQSAAAKDKWVTFWIWDQWVLKAWVKPSCETCMQVLEICADHGAIRVAESARTILRFIQKEANVSNPDQHSDPESNEPPNHESERVETLLAKTYGNATSREPRPSPLEIRRITAEWWMFDIEDRIGLNPKGTTGFRSLKMNPWSMLSDFNDPGHAWARVLSEREEVQQQHDDREALRQANVRRANIDAGRATMVKILPAQLLADIERVASAELDIDETDLVTADEAQSESVMNSTTISDREPTESIPVKIDTLQPRIRLIDPKRSAVVSAKVENARIAKWEELGLDIQTALQMDELKGNRAWTLGDTEANEARQDDREDEENSSNSVSDESQRNIDVPRVRLLKLPETSPKAEWYSEWTEMMLARRRFQRARVLKMKKDTEARRDAVKLKGAKPAVWHLKPRYGEKVQEEESEVAQDEGSKIDGEWVPFG